MLNIDKDKLIWHSVDFKDKYYILDSRLLLRMSITMLPNVIGV
jgi:hypothetical protein